MQRSLDPLNSLVRHLNLIQQLTFYSQSQMNRPTHDIAQIKTMFMNAKEKLDQRRIAGTVTVDSAPVVLKLIAKLEQLEQQLQNKPTDSTLEHSVGEREEAITGELRRLTVQNNSLRVEIISLKDRLHAQRQKIQQLCDERLGKVSSEAANMLMLRGYRQRQQQLRQQLTQTIYKYNELMDLLHEDSHRQRDYIKRLLKHKTLHPPPPSPSVQGKSGHSQHTDPSARISMLQAQLLLRDAEINRLQKTLQDECETVGMKTWQRTRSEQRLALLEEQLDRVTNQNAHLRAELAEARLDPQRGVADKHRQALLRAKSNEERLKTVCQEQQFDLYLRERELSRAKNSSQETDQKDENRRMDPTNNLEAYVLRTRQKDRDSKKRIDQDYYIVTDRARKESNTNTRNSCKLGPVNVRKLSNTKNIPGKANVLSNNKIKQQLQHQQKETVKSPLHSNSNNQPQEKSKLQKLPNSIPSDPHLRTAKVNNQQHKQAQSASAQKQYVFEAAQSKGLPAKKPNSKHVPPKSPSPHKAISNIQREKFLKEIKQKQTRITELKQLLKLAPKQGTVVHQTQNILAHKSETNNLIFNQHHNQHINMPASNETHTLKKRLAKTQQQLKISLSQCQHLKERVQQLQDLNLQSIKLEENKPNRNIHIEEQRMRAQEKMKIAQQKLIHVNQENLQLQSQLNEALQLIKRLQSASAEPEPIQASQSNQEELLRLRREVARLNSLLSSLKLQKDVLSRQLRQTELQLQTQQQEMRRFQKSIEKKYKEPRNY